MKISFFIDARYYLPDVPVTDVKASAIDGFACKCKALTKKVDISYVENVLHALESDCTSRDLVQQREVIS